MKDERNGILVTTLTSVLVLLIFVCIRMAGARPASVYDELTVGFIYVGDESTPYTANFMRATEELRAKYGDKVRILERFNVSDEDPSPVIYELIRERCNIIFANSYGYGEAMKEMAAQYPNVQFCQATCEDANQEPVLKNYHNFMGEISYIDKLENFYKPKNVEDMKAYFKARLALESIRYLDKQAYEYYMDSNLDRTNQFAQRIDRDPDLVFFSMLNKNVLTAAVDQMYIDYCFDENTYNEIKDFVKQIKAKYEILIEQSTFLSDASKKAVKEKLYKMGENVIKPSNRADFTGVTLKTKEEGGTFLDALCVLSRLANEHTGVIVQQQIPKDYWDIYDGSLSTTVTNATYDGMQNCIYIRAGILVEPVYTPDAPIEKKLGSFVTVVGHEISHAFDSKSIYYDAEGRESKVITKEELELWSDTAERIGSHFEGYKAFDGAEEYNSSTMISGEVIADAEGVKCALMIAKDHENFDYDMFFRSFAGFWKFVMTKQEQMNLINKNPHPLEFLRINYTLAQFDEFVETYGIKPGDGMYMDPSERIIIW